MILLTIPIVYPAIVKLGFDPDRFGVIVVVELGTMMPPIGINVSSSMRLTLLAVLPILSTFLPSLM